MAHAAVQVLPPLLAITATYVNIQTQPFCLILRKKTKRKRTLLYDILMYLCTAKLEWKLNKRRANLCSSEEFDISAAESVRDKLEILCLLKYVNEKMLP